LYPGCTSAGARFMSSFLQRRWMPSAYFSCVLAPLTSRQRCGAEWGTIRPLSSKLNTCYREKWMPTLITYAVRDTRVRGVSARRKNQKKSSCPLSARRLITMCPMATCCVLLPPPPPPPPPPPSREWRARTAAAPLEGLLGLESPLPCQRERERKSI